MFSVLIVGAVLIAGGFTWVAFMIGPSVLFAIGVLLMTWACISMFAGRAVGLEKGASQTDRGH